MTERKINLVYNKFVSGSPAKNISSEKFYTNLKGQTGASDLCVYLTNGTNKRLDTVGTGTTEAFKTLSSNVGDLFNVTHATTVFDSKSKSFEKKTEIDATIKASTQVWTHPTAPYTGMYAGSVIRVNVTGTTAFPVCGGYHINGIELRKFDDNKEKVETDSVGLVKAYYTAIMEDFFKLATDASSGGTSSVKHYVLHLAQIPGNEYGGTQITGNAFHTAVTEWIASKANVSPPLSMSMTISIDFEKPPSPLPGPDDVKNPSGAKTTAATATAAVDTEKVDVLRARLERAKVKLEKTVDPDNTAFTIAEEIFNAFFKDDKDTAKQNNDFLTAQIAKLNKTSIFSSGKANTALALISSRLAGITVPATTTTAATTTPAKPVGPTKKYVFAFDIDGTLVRSGRLDKAVESASRHVPFNPSTDATDHEAMITLMKDIIDAGHHVWIVTANTKIAKADFEANYLKGGNGIIYSPTYYFMNPTTVDDKDLKTQFVSGQISPYTDTTTLDLDFNKTDGGHEFQSKGLKPYAMIAKWLEKNSDMKDVQMYLFDDSANYGTTCKNVKENKLEFVQIKPDDSSAGVSPGQFKSDVLQKANEKFVAIAKTPTPTPKAAATSGGNNLNVMTFNTWHEALGDSPSKKFCMSGGKNICQDNIKKEILLQMDKPGPVVIFLQEFTYNFQEFFGSDIQITREILESKCGVLIPKESKSTTSTKAFRHFTMTYKTRSFYVYTGQIGNSVMTTIYSSDLCNESATQFLMGNLASGMNPGGDQHEIVPTFSGFTTNIATEYVRGIQGGLTNALQYDFTGGDRPFMILQFEGPLKLILLNIHAPKDVPFGKPGIMTKVNPKAPKKTVAEFAFDALGPFFDKNVFDGKPKKSYSFVAGGDFNTKSLDKLNNIFKDTNSTILRNGNTCCTTDGGVMFTTAVDHIFSTLPITKYEVYVPQDNSSLKTSDGAKYYFSDHLPVYATITFPPVASGDSGASAASP